MGIFPKYGWEKNNIYLKPPTSIYVGVSLNGGTPHFTPQNDHFSRKSNSCWGNPSRWFIVYNPLLRLHSLEEK